MLVFSSEVWWMNETLSVSPVIEKAEAEIHLSAGRTVCFTHNRDFEFGLCSV